MGHMLAVNTGAGLQSRVLHRTRLKEVAAHKLVLCGKRYVEKVES